MDFMFTSRTQNAKITEELGRRIALRKIIAALGEFLRKADMLLLALCVVATAFGIVVISSTTAWMGARRFVLIQSAALLIGIVLYIVFTLIDIDIIAERREVLLVFNILFISTLFIWGVMKWALPPMVP